MIHKVSFHGVEKVRHMFPLTSDFGDANEKKQMKMYFWSTMCKSLINQL